MILQNMDETLDVNPTVKLNEEQLRLAKVSEIHQGTEFLMTCKAVVVEITEGEAENGMPATTAILELSRITLEGEEEESKQQPPEKSRTERMYPNTY